MENNSNECPVCKEAAQGPAFSNMQGGNISCPRCGEFSITKKALANIRATNLTGRQRANISGWIRENQNFKISETSLEWLEKLPTPSFHSRADKFLLELERKTEFAGHNIELPVEEWTGLAWSINKAELFEIIRYLETESRIEAKCLSHYIANITSSINCKILPDGWAHLEKLKRINADMKQAFVAMWFDSSMDKVFNEAIVPGISDAGYTHFRVDQKEYIGKIDDEIIAQIRRSRFVVADLTGHRNNVYFEVGFAKGLGLEVILTCKEKGENENGIDFIHSDISQYNCLVWKENNLEDFRKRLQFRIESVLGRYDRQPPDHPH